MDSRVNVGLYLVSLLVSAITTTAIFMVKSEVSEVKVLILEKLSQSEAQAQQRYVTRQEFDLLQRQFERTNPGSHR